MAHRYPVHPSFPAQEGRVRIMRGHQATRRRAAVFVLGLVLVAFRTGTGVAAAPHQKSFATPEAAVDALVAAMEAHDTHALLAVLGSGAQPLISSGDAVADREVRERLVHAYQEAHSLLKADDKQAVLQIGKDDWPFPIPLVKSTAGWRFDTDAGKEEILDRRIGANELATIQACLAYVDAQREYYQRDPDHDTLLEYARKFVSTPGKRDGLYWDTQPGEDESPLGPHFADARAHGYAMKGGPKPAPYHGYYYRILTRQGPAAAGGAYDYLVEHGKMMGGFALVAYPAQYDNSGIMTFIVNHDGVVFEKDLGPATATIAHAMQAFNPDSTWKRVGADQPASTN